MNLQKCLSFWVHINAFSAFLFVLNSQHQNYGSHVKDGFFYGYYSVIYFKLDGDEIAVFVKHFNLCDIPLHYQGKLLKSVLRYVEGGGKESAVGKSARS